MYKFVEIDNENQLKEIFLTYSVDEKIDCFPVYVAQVFGFYTFVKPKKYISFNEWRDNNKSFATTENIMQALIKSEYSSVLKYIQTLENDIMRLSDEIIEPDNMFTTNYDLALKYRRNNK